MMAREAPRATVVKRTTDGGSIRYDVRYRDPERGARRRTFNMRKDAEQFKRQVDGAASNPVSRWVSSVERQSRHWAEQAAALVLVLLTVGAIALLVLAGSVFWDMIHLLFHHNKQHFGDITADIINEVLLVFIIVELVETAYYQVKEGLGRALNRKLVEKLLIIGLLSSIRHLLSIGAELSTNPKQLGHGATFLRVLEGLGMIAGIVLILVFGLIAFGRYFPKDDIE